MISNNQPIFSIRWKIVLLYLLLLLIVFVAIAVVVVRINGGFLVKQRSSDEMNITDTLALKTASLLSSSQTKELYDLCVSESKQSGGRILVMSKTGTVIVDSHSELNGRAIMTAEIDDIINRRMDRSYGFHRLGDVGSKEWVGYYASAIIYEGATIGIFLRSNSIMDLVQQLDSLQMTIQVYFFALLIVVILLGFFISEVITRPINRLQSVMLKASRGIFSERAPVTGNDEVSELSRTFNMMSEKIENLDNTRNRFISNASHELKTPLSAIKVLVESILLQGDDELDPEMVRDFLGDVNKEVDRLSHIVGDLLTLVQMDSSEIRLNLKDASLAETVRDTLKRLSPIAKHRGVTVGLQVGEDSAVKIDIIRFSQIIYNLVDNSIKYARENGSVQVEVSRTDTEAIVRVSDDGIGIPPADIPHLFDRFYRVDKARSRETGGTGLGLSIVREVINMHHGDISVESQENVGTTFIVRLPLPEEDIII